MIAAIASYHGDLIKGDYQFTFGGSSKQEYKRHDKYNGFLMAHSGYIKHFVLEDFGIKFYTEEDYDNPSDLIKEKCGANTPIPLFTLVLIKDNYLKFEAIDLGTLNITYPG